MVVPSSSKEPTRPDEAVVQPNLTSLTSEEQAKLNDLATNALKALTEHTLSGNIQQKKVLPATLSQISSLNKVLRATSEESAFIGVAQMVPQLMKDAYEEAKLVTDAHSKAKVLVILAELGRQRAYTPEEIANILQTLKEAKEVLEPFKDITQTSSILSSIAQIEFQIDPGKARETIAEMKEVLDKYITIPLKFEILLDIAEAESKISLADSQRTFSTAKEIAKDSSFVVEKLVEIAQVESRVNLEDSQRTLEESKEIVRSLGTNLEGLLMKLNLFGYIVMEELNIQPNKARDTLEEIRGVYDILSNDLPDQTLGFFDLIQIQLMISFIEADLDPEAGKLSIVRIKEQLKAFPQAHNDERRLILQMIDQVESKFKPEEEPKTLGNLEQKKGAALRLSDEEKKVETLIKIAQDEAKLDFDTAMQTFQTAKEVALAIDPEEISLYMSVEMRASALLKIATAWYSFDVGSAMKTLEQAKQAAISISSPFEEDIAKKAEILFQICKFEVKINSPKAAETFQKAINAAKSIGRKKEKSTLLADFALRALSGDDI